jgi:hypothetical protein
MCDTTEGFNSNLDRIKCYMLGKGLGIVGPPSEADRVKHYRVFELIAEFFTTSTL